MPKELLIDGVKFKRLPNSDYYIGPDGTMFFLKQFTPDKIHRYRLTKNHRRVYRSTEDIIELYKKL